jgi:hypothetical protein
MKIISTALLFVVATTGYATASVNVAVSTPSVQLHVGTAPSQQVRVVERERVIVKEKEIVRHKYNGKHKGHNKQKKHKKHDD